ncbi:hypothetical protein AWB74_00498 [Caballeronia arvi]|uniref:Uncharacterized protein n=1 Tax=Caballeronia arvi TaxID=1777135 RepID=A0A158FAS2_9BURK|nr:hypothetical protein [Caballeronia arvi]SAL16110.1 hypothetical protein AWB74_00498 [Caballeronia arvi]
MIGDALSGMLCVLAALSAGASLRVGANRSLWVAGAIAVVVCAVSGGAGAVALSLAAVAGFAGFRLNRGAPSASTQALLATLAFVVWLLPESNDGAYAVTAGGAMAALGYLLCARFLRESANPQALHLACAGACAALAYVIGAQPGALAVVPTLALLALIGAHLSLAVGGNVSAPFAGLMAGVASCGLAIAAAMAGAHGALAVTAAVLAIGCAQSAALVGIVREVR